MQQGRGPDHSDRAGLRDCPCVAKGAPFPRVHCSLRDDAHPVCTGCGLVLGYALLVHHDASDRGDGGNASGRMLVHTSMDSWMGHRNALSAAYSRSVHFAEFMALATITGPAIPDSDMDAIAAAYAHTDHGRNWEDPLDLTCSRVRELLRGSMSRDNQRRYAERWLQIIHRLCGPDWFERYGPPLLPGWAVHDMKQRFHWFNRVYDHFHREQHPLFQGRNNVPYLCTVARALLFQAVHAAEPHWAAQHRQWLRLDLDLLVFWERHVLLAWRLEFFWTHSWVFRWLKSPSSQLHNELMVAHVLERLRMTRHHVLSWVEHPCLLPQRPAAEWTRELRRLLSSLSSSRSRSRARSSRSPSGPSPRSSGPKRSTSRSCLPPTGSRVPATTGPSSCSSHSTSSTDTLLAESTRLLARSCPKSAVPSSACFSEARTATELKRLLSASKNSNGTTSGKTSIGADPEWEWFCDVYLNNNDND